MSNPNNLGQSNANPLTSTNKYFNNFYSVPGTISGNQNDAIVAYFQKYTQGNRAAAEALASAVIYTSLAQKTDPMSVLENFIKLPSGEIDSYLAMFLNLNRKGTSFLGINNQPIVNKYVKRAILS